MGLFSRNKKTSIPNYVVDMHSHLIPGVDDGSTNLEETIELIKKFKDLGIKKLITTPHIMGDFYKNSPDNLIPLRNTIREELDKLNIDISFDVAAEYYLDESFLKKIEEKEPLLTFGDNLILFETSYMNSSSLLDPVVFELQSAGYKPILAHPERYIYMYNDFESYTNLFDKGVLFQLNLLSLVGYYSKGAQKIAEKLIKNNMIHFVSSDCHKSKHLDLLEKAMTTKAYKTLLEQGIRNLELL